MSTIQEVEKVVYTAKIHTTGGRDGGMAQSNDDRLSITLAIPGSGGTGTNPEQLFAAGWSACFEGALGIAARKLKVSVPREIAIDSEVDLCVKGSSYFLRARLNVILPGVPRDVCATLIESAHKICPYSKAIRGNIDVLISLVESDSTTAIIQTTLTSECVA